MSARNAPAGRPPTSDPSSRRSHLDLARGVVDGSIGMAILRRLTGRPRSSRLEMPVPPVAAAGTERAYRMSATYYGHPTQRVGGGSPVAAGAPRERIVRDSAAALVVFAVLGLVIVFWPQGPIKPPADRNPGVVRAGETPTPDPTTFSTTPVATTPTNPSGDVAAETDVPIGSPDPTHVVRQATPAPTRTSFGIAGPAGTPTLAPATASPAATALATAGPTPSPELTPSATPGPTFEPTPTPIVEPSPS